MDTRTRIRLFAASTVAALALVTGWGLSTDAGRHAANVVSSSSAASQPATGDDAG
jgi:hypothetical protein